MLDIQAVGMPIGATVTQTLSIGANGTIVNDGGIDNDFRVESDTNTHMLFVDAGGDHVNIGTGSDYGGKFNIIGTKTVGSGIPSSQLTVVDDASLAAGIGGSINFHGVYNSNNDITTAGSIEAYKRNATTGQYGFGLQFKSRTNGGANDERLYMDEANTIFNDPGQNIDFRVESDAYTHMLFVDAGLDSVGVGTGSLTTAHSMFVAGKGIGIRNSVNGSNDNWTSLHNTEAGSASNLIIQPGTGGGFTFTHGSGLHAFPATGYDTVFNQNGNDADFRVESDNNANMLFLDASVDRISMGTSDSNDSTLTIRSTNNNFAMVQESAATIPSGGIRARMFEGTYAINGNSSNSVLSIPITSQGGLWVQYQVELTVVSGEYNISTTARGGSCIFSFVSLTVLQHLVEQQVTGNISSVTLDSANMEVDINFSSAYTAGQSGWEGVLVHAKVFSYGGLYFEMDNATLN
jgi:hypothetical protein